METNEIIDSVEVIVDQAKDIKVYDTFNNGFVCGVGASLVTVATVLIADKLIRPAIRKFIRKRKDKFEDVPAIETKVDTDEIEETTEEEEN